MNKAGLKKIGIPILAAVVIVGALLRREYVEGGHWLTIAALVYYVAVNLPFFFSNIKKFSSSPAKVKARLLIWAVFVFIIVNGIVTMEISYFAVLVLFAVDYLLTAPVKGGGDE